jgi:MYXO-CTERM domain-containing protein
MGAADFATLGGDVLPTMSTPAKPGTPGMRRRMSWSPSSNFVLTRLHARYDKNALGEDLVFRKAKPIVGGREIKNQNGKLETSASISSFNNFQGRYIIRHPWTGAINCKNPIRGRWGGPPSGVKYKGPSAAQDLAFVPRGKVWLGHFAKPSVVGQVLSSKGSKMGLAQSIGKGQPSPAPVPAPTTDPQPVDPQPTDPAPTTSGFTPTPAPTGPLPPGPPTTPPQSGGGCGSCATATPSPSSPGWWWLLAAIALLRRRRG